jgi:hypothetical protein
MGLNTRILSDCLGRARSLQFNAFLFCALGLLIDCLASRNETVKTHKNPTASIIHVHFLASAKVSIPVKAFSDSQ